MQFNPNQREQVYFLQTDDLRIEVLQNQHHIWLEVDGIVQSAFTREPPYRPVLSHSVIMMLPLIHDVEPASILELGGGGQSTQRYLSLTHPEIDFESIEYSQDVINATLNCLPLPEVLNIKQADAFECITDYAKLKREFDWVMIDLFQGSISPGMATQASFLENVRKLISPQGWLIFNCLSNELESLRKVQLAIESAFDQPVKVFAAPGMVNHIFMLKRNASFEFPEEIEQHNLSESIRTTHSK